jgi:hypothetical protein
MRKDYCFITDWLKKRYKDSQTYRLIKVFWEGTKINFRYRFLGKISEINKENNSVILNNSRFIRWVLNLSNIWKYRILNYAKTSIILESVKEIKKEVYFSPVKISSIIIVTAILTNISFSILFNKEIGLLSWVIRTLLFFAGLAGLSSNATWEDVKKTNFILKYLK